MAAAGARCFGRSACPASTLLYAGGRKLLGDVVFERHYPPFDSAAPNAAPAAAVRVA